MEKTFEKARKEVAKGRSAEVALIRREAILEAVAFAARELLTSGTWEKNIQAVIERFGKATKASRVAIFQNHEGDDGEPLTSQCWEWEAPDIASQIDPTEIQNFPWHGGLARWKETLPSGDVISGHVNQFPPSEQQILGQRGVKSIAVVPIFVSKEWWGIIGFDEVRAEREWSAGEIEALKTASGVLGEAIQSKRAEEALRKSEQQYRLLVETMNEGLLVQEDGVITYVNNKFLQKMGYTNEAIIGQSVTLFLDEGSELLFKTEMATQRRGEQNPYEIEWKAKDGRKIPCLLSPEPLFDVVGRFKGSFAVITDITELKQTEQALKEREKELKIRSDNLEEVNTALRVLLKRREEDQTELGEKVLHNVKDLVLPYLEKIRERGLDEKQTTYANIMESNLDDIITPFSRTLSSQYFNLTPTEIRLANLIKEGKTTKEIATLLHLATKTIEVHRTNIRRKLRIKNKKVNLRTHLTSIL